MIKKGEIQPGTSAALRSGMRRRVAAVARGRWAKGMLTTELPVHRQ